MTMRKITLELTEEQAVMASEAFSLFAFSIKKRMGTANDGKDRVREEICVQLQRLSSAIESQLKEPSDATT